MLGATAIPRAIFRDLVSYIERNEIKPLLAEVFPLHEIKSAQKAFMEKEHLKHTDF